MYLKTFRLGFIFLNLHDQIVCLPKRMHVFELDSADSSTKPKRIFNLDIGIKMLNPCRKKAISAQKPCTMSQVKNKDIGLSKCVLQKSQASITSFLNEGNFGS